MQLFQMVVLVSSVVTVRAAVAQETNCTLAPNPHQEATLFDLAEIASASPAPATPLAVDKPKTNPPLKGVTPNDVFRRADLLDRCLDVVLAREEIKVPPGAVQLETSVHSLHVCQLAVACTNTINQFVKECDGKPRPVVELLPSCCALGDVHGLVDQMLATVRNYASLRNVTALPTDERNGITGKMPIDVFHKMSELQIKLRALTRNRRITSNHIYAELTRAIEDVKQFSAATERATSKVDFPPGNRKPPQVLAEVIEIRRELSRIRSSLDLPTIPVPQVHTDAQLGLIDVFQQTQIVIAELAALKLHQKVEEAAPQAVSVRGMTPADCCEKAVLLKSLLEQI